MEHRDTSVMRWRSRLVAGLAIAALALIGLCGACGDVGQVTVFDPSVSPPAEDGALRFAALGDTGTGDAAQFAVGRALADTCGRDGCDLVLLLGDNFYDDGVASVNDPLFRTAFEEPYADVDAVFYPVFGNHDVNGSREAQIAYSELSAKWEFPARYYVQQRQEGDVTVAFVAIDSTDFDEEQAAWLDATLDGLESDWIVVYDHHPYFSASSRGDDAGGIATLSAAILCGRVDVILSGHHHNKQDLIGERDGCEFRQIVLGSGGRELEPVTPDERTLFAAATFGFGWFEATEDRLDVVFYDADGGVEYRAEIDNTAP